MNTLLIIWLFISFIREESAANMREPLVKATATTATTRIYIYCRNRRQTIIANYDGLKND